MRVFVYTFFIMLLSQCTTTPKTAGKRTDVGLWTGKVQMTNKTTNNRKWANVVWASNSLQDQMRVDITAAVVDVPIATFLKNDEGFHLWLFTEKKHFVSKDGEKLFKHLTKLSVHPKIFYSMLGQPAAPSSNWQCKAKSTEMDCYLKSKNTQLFVNFEDNDERVIKLNKGAKALRLRLSRSKVQLKEGLFKTLSTSQFKTIQI